MSTPTPTAASFRVIYSYKATAAPTPEPDSAVRMIYATPSDVDPNPDYMAAMESAMGSIQEWFADRLDGRTLQVQEPAPQHCVLPKPEDYYAGEDGYHRVIVDLNPCVPIWYDTPYEVWAVYADVAYVCGESELGRGGFGTTVLHRDDLEGITNAEGHASCGYHRPQSGWIGGLVHELGHAFGLPHPPGCDEGLETCDWAAVMQTGYVDYPDTYLTEEDIAMLKESQWFQPPRESQ